MTWAHAKGNNTGRKIECLNCKTITIQNSIIDKKYCSKLCQGYYWKKQNPEKRKSIFKKWYKNKTKQNPNWLSERYTTRRLKEPNYRSKQSRYSHKRYLGLRRTAIEKYGNSCTCCGEIIYEFLAIDHINGGGGKHRKEIKINIYEWLRKNKYPKGFQILCHNCNMAKGFYGFCPHTKI